MCQRTQDSSGQGPVQVASRKVMLVDGQRERQAAVAQLLALAGCELIAVLTSAEDLLAQVLGQQPDAVVIDLDSPGRDTSGKPADGAGTDAAADGDVQPGRSGRGHRACGTCRG